MSSKYLILDHECPHFITFATVNSIEALSKPLHKEIVLDSLRYCIAQKGLILYAYVIMNNHVHLIASATSGNNLSSILRDFKKFTSKKILNEIQQSQGVKRNWMLRFFREAGKRNSNNKYYQFWQQDNHPIELNEAWIFDQKLEYVHQNPVAAQIVFEPEHYVHSSARDYAGLPGQLDLVLA